MFGGLVHLPDSEIDRVVERVLTNKRIEQIARRVAVILLEEMAKDRQGV